MNPQFPFSFNQQESASANKTYKLISVDLGNVKKKLDLPVQKNLLTKYFCILLKFEFLFPLLMLFLFYMIHTVGNLCLSFSVFLF